MAKIKISYEKPEELETVKQLLRPVTKTLKVSKSEKGQYKKAYIETREQQKANVLR